MKVETPGGGLAAASLRNSANIVGIAPRSQSTLAKATSSYQTTRSKSPFDMMKGIS